MRFKTLSYTFFSLVLTVAANAQTKPTTTDKKAPATKKPATTDKKPAEKPAADKPVTTTQPPADPASKEPIKEEFEVVRPYKPVLADAAKIRRSPDLNNYKTFKANLSYSILDKRLELNSDIGQLQSLTYQPPAPLPFRNNYAKAGFGNFNTTLGELYLGNGPDEALQVGFFAKHLAQSGPLNKQSNSRQQAALYGRTIQDKVTLHGELNFDRLGTYFYGVNPDMPESNLDPRKQRFSSVGIKGELAKNYDPNKALDYGAKIDGYLLGSRYNSKENRLVLSGFINNVYKQFNIGANGSLDFTNTKDSLGIGNHLFRINPYAKFQGKNYKVSVGVNFVQKFGEVKGTHLFPVVSAELPIVPQFATVFGGYTGDVVKGTLRDFAFENPYIGKSIIKNATERSNIYGGIKGNFGAGFGFKGMIYHKTIDDLPLYISSKYGFERFQIMYDKANITGLEGEVNVKASETLTWTGKVEINKYSMDTTAHAWLKPGLRLYSNFRFSLSKKLIIDGEGILTGDRDAFTYDATGADRVVTVKSYLDISGGAEYQIKDKLGVYLRVNNLFGNKYQQFVYYPNLGLNVLGGLNYSF